MPDNNDRIELKFKNQGEKVVSKVTGKTYIDDKEHVIHIWNMTQIYKFLTAGVDILDIFPTHDRNNNEKICFVISRSDFDTLQPLWIAHKL